MFIDVIIPTYNRAEVLERSIESVLNQTYKSFVLHIVDDGSTDHTSEILKLYAHHPQIKIYHQDNHGVSAARNLGVLKSHHEWISFLDSDDEWLPHKLAVQVDFIRKNPHIEFVHSEEQWIRNGVRVNPKKKHSKTDDDILIRSLHFCLISPSTVLMSRKIFEEFKGFDENLIVCEDFDLWIKILSQYEIGFISEALIKKYGGHVDQLSTKYIAMDYWRIKSLANIYHTLNLTAPVKNNIKEILLIKSELLMKNYAKYENYKESLEIAGIISKITSDN